MKPVLAAALMTCCLVLPAGAKPAPKPFPDAAQLNQMAARFTPTPLSVDTSRLSPGDRKALAKLIAAGRIIDSIFMQQHWSGDLGLYARLQKDLTPLGRARLHYFWINKSPWSELEGHTAFLPGVPARKPPGANFYPPDMAKEEFERWASFLAPAQKEQATGFFTVIRRDPKGELIIVPYSREYRAGLERCSALLKEAAALTGNDSLQRFLTTRADAFLSNDYFASDLDWMDLDAPLDITIGPYETYDDEIFGYKAAFEAYIGLRDEQESAKLAIFSGLLQEIEDHLPEDPQYRTPQLGPAAPIRVVNEILAAGDGAHGVQTAAFNLPNDDAVVQQKGSKRVMLKNVQEAKFRSVLLPIASRTLGKAEQGDVSFDMFFTHTLAHELMHGLGPHQIVIAGRQTNPRLELQETFSPIEEAKADATGLFALQYMMENASRLGLDQLLRSDAVAQRQLYVTFLASSFRSMRFGLSEAHGKAVALQFNYLWDQGGWVRRPDGTFTVDMIRIKSAVRDLVHDLLTLEATGDYAGARKMLDTYGVLRPQVQDALKRLQNIPIDIEPVFVTADELSGTHPAGEAAAAKAKAKAKP
jgi:hypothetical protein